MLATYLIHALPPEARRAFGLKEAASYAGCSVGYFRKLVSTGIMPKPMPMPGVQRWDKRSLDKALDILSGNSAQEVSPLDLWRQSNNAN